jgi:hypothetical protein
MKFILLAFVLAVAGCASAPSTFTSTHSNTMDIIAAAADAVPKGIRGEFILNIKASGKQDKFIYLNTELDYRDQRSITVAIHPSVATQFETKYGMPPQDYFVGKSILVKGQAKRIKINFNSQGRSTSKYYYQTHIRVLELSQIEVVNAHS